MAFTQHIDHIPAVLVWPSRFPAGNMQSAAKDARVRPHVPSDRMTWRYLIASYLRLGIVHHEPQLEGVHF
jgi:hypothetical protein